MPDSRPRSREKNVTGTAGDLHKRGSGLGTGPVGTSGAGMGSGSHHSSGGAPVRGKTPLILIILALLLGGGGGFGLLGGDSGSVSTTPTVTTQQTVSDYTVPTGTSTSSHSSAASSVSSLSSLFGGNFLSATNTSSGWTYENNTGRLNTEVADGARSKRTTIKGDGNDTVTIMVYMCGTDLESKSGMASADLKEMASATLNDQLNIIVMTGGCRAWKSSGISNQVNQIWQIQSGSMKCLEQDMGSKAMTDASNLTTFIQYCSKNFPANRQELIFWDHGGGSLTGYGYDEKNSYAGSMTLADINTALKNAGQKFDFIGFDACLMATLETGLMLEPYADYLIASEETEPGVGWYYTNWVSEFAANTSRPTIEVGKKIADDFVSVCAQKCPGQKTTLSVVDLTELAAVTPGALKDFSTSTQQLITDKAYQTVSNARTNAREFATSSKIDQIDLIDLAENMGTEEGKALSQALRGAIKYNKTASNMTDAYGISIYFPYKKTSKVDSAVKTYKAIGMDNEYGDCIKAFASLEVSGQAASGGTAMNPTPILIGNTTSSSAGSVDLMSTLLGAFLGGDVSSIVGLSADNIDFLSGKALSDEETVSYLSDHMLDDDALVWTPNSKGENVLQLSEKQWSLVQSITLNMFYDDGSGYIDLGCDSVFDFDDNGNLLGTTDNSWLAINNQVVPFYYLDTVDDGTNYTISGYVPAMLNGERVEILLNFDQDQPYGYVAGYQYVYKNGETETVAKATEALQNGDKLDFICDYYNYNDQYEDSYYLGETMTVDGEFTISNLILEESKVKATYCLTDIYNKKHWTSVIE